MKIAINGLIIDRYKAGIGHYGYNLVNNIIKNNFYDYYIYLQNHIIISYDNIIYRQSYRKNYYRIIDEQVILPFEFNKYDLVHLLDYSSPVIFKMKVPFIITVHDLTFLKFPETFTYMSRKYKNFIIPYSIKNSTKIITISENSKRDLIKYFPHCEDKVEVIYPGRPNINRVSNKDEIDKVKKRYKIFGNYILHVGTIEPRKNIKRLVKAYKLLLRENKDFKDIKLVLIGKKGWLYKEIFDEIGELLNDKIIYLGYVEQKDIPILYSGAEFFIYPSLYEGFGLPPLEAMTCGVPVIVSNSSSLPEVVGDAGLYINPYDIETIKEAMSKLLTNKNLKEQMINKGYSQIKKFDWENSVSKIMKIYNDILK